MSTLIMVWIFFWHHCSEQCEREISSRGSRRPLSFFSSGSFTLPKLALRAFSQAGLDFDLNGIERLGLDSLAILLAPIAG